MFNTLRFSCRVSCVLLLTAMFAVCGTGPGVLAADPGWRVSKASGDVTVSTSAGPRAAITAGALLNPGDDIRTGPDSRALLVRGEETILIAPNSIVGIPLEKSEGLSTTIIQQAGSILLEVERRNVKHFEVETPYLAAVVKGTQFRVTVDEHDSRVEVLRGQVEVKDLKSGQYAIVQPEQTARVTALGSIGLSLSGPGALGPVQQGAPRRSAVSPVALPNSPSIADNTPAAQQLPGALPRAEMAPTPTPSRPTTVRESVWNAVAAMLGNDAAKNQRHKDPKDDVIFAFGMSGAIGVAVAAIVAIGRHRQKRRQV